MADKVNDDKDPQYEELLNSNFKQQKLAAWRPVPTITSTTITFVAFGIVFITIGIIIISFSNNIVEIESPNYLTSKIDTNGISQISLTVTDTMKAPIMFYYQMKNFYQNHRRYVKSKSNNQLAGQILSDVEVKSDCDPVVYNKDIYPGLKNYFNNVTLDQNEVASPCGLIAKSFFNDTFQIEYITTQNTKISIDEKNIAWESDKELKYKMPEKTSAFNPADHMWLDVTDEHFMVWMRPAGLPTFRKLWGRINQDLAPGAYTVKVKRNYQIDFGGEVAIVLSTVNAFGGKNSFLGISYIVVGGICLVMAILFFFGYKTHNKTA